MNNESREETARRYAIKITLAKMLEGSMIVVVKNEDEAYVAEAHGARAIIPIELTNLQNASKNSNRLTEADLSHIHDIMDFVTIPIIARVRVGHTSRAKAFEGGKVNFLYEYEDISKISENYIFKHPFKIPFITEAKSLSYALKRINEGSSLIINKSSNEDSDNVGSTFNTVRAIFKEIETLHEADDVYARTIAVSAEVPEELVKMVARKGKLPVPFFASGGIFTPIDVSLFMKLGCDGVIISNCVFNVINPETHIKKISQALNNYNDPNKLMDLMTGIGPPIKPS
ncbi:hypothetical protein COEREDRAFT_89473 [Coemansia reversa NRRL 1564]|uniref:pyridoxal 5'-phosphate synthase (glutamine hydrolyzing) n=1 Tax=Coemansia reversa (strain ATCC 12441 / NRRL 1564) TaxID=763665 RepID=A0A2G5B3J4_COERN|nr:hypothetical protein COEREDRAFT_89473 [Coemansia reversa NRRL 1564]|eukprot:PIA13576.1 hypothetical protein COEREDRAFT_89473 [Coemansia reversa NRRL 1564]